MFRHIRNHQVGDALFVTGDIHSGWACELPYDPASYPARRLRRRRVRLLLGDLQQPQGHHRLAAADASLAVEAAILANNRHIKYLNFDDHGFSVLDITSQRAQMDWFVIGDRADPNTPVTWTRSMATKAGTGKLHEVDGPVGS